MHFQQFERSWKLLLSMWTWEWLLSWLLVRYFVEQILHSNFNSAFVNPFHVNLQCSLTFELCWAFRTLKFLSFMVYSLLMNNSVVFLFEFFLAVRAWMGFYSWKIKENYQTCSIAIRNENLTRMPFQMAFEIMNASKNFWTFWAAEDLVPVRR